MTGPDAGPDPRIHREAAVGFQSAAGAYERGRPSFPPAAVAHVISALDIGPGRTVLDLGAGTGKFTRLLLPAGPRLVCVEPVEAMRAALVALVPGVTVLDGTAEAIPLADETVDAVVVSQAFHWFDAPRALHEIARVLRPAGGLALVWNVRDESVPWVARLTEIMDRHRAGTPSHADGPWRAVDESAAFEPLQHRSFRHRQPLDAGLLVDRVASVSFIAALPPDARAGVVDEVRALVASEPALAGRARFELPYRTDVFWTRRAAAAGGPEVGESSE